MQTHRRIIACSMVIASLSLVGCGSRGASQQAAAKEPPAAGAPEASTVAYAGPQVSATIDVYKSPTCGCCKAWIGHLQEAGFRVVAHDTNDVEAVKGAVGVPKDVVSCHTAVVNGYVIEGHVPPAMIAKLITEKPAGVAGLGVEGMPMGAPGMEGMGRKDPFQVKAWNKAGQTRVFAEVN